MRFTQSQIVFCIVFFILLTTTLGALAQVPDVGPGKCVEAPGMPCNTPSPRYNNRGSSSGGSSYSGPTAHQRAALQHQQVMNNMMMGTMQGLMNNFMSGFQRGLEQNRQRQQQQQQELLHLARQEMERERQRALTAQRALERNRKQFQEAKARIAGAVRSMGTTGTSARPVLRVGETTGAFGTSVLKPRATGALVAMDEKAKMACGQGLLYAAGGAAIDGSQDGLAASFKEAAFLSRQANQAVSGGHLEVTCPTSHSDSSSFESDGIRMVNETIQQQSEVFSALYGRVADNMERMTNSRKIAEETEQKLAETQAERDQTARMVETLQAEMPPIQNNQAGLEANSSATDPEELAAKQSALEEALAALEQSEQALNDVKKVYDQNKSIMDEMEESMKTMESLMQKALTDPQGVTDLRDELGLPSKRKNKDSG